MKKEVDVVGHIENVCPRCNERMLLVVFRLNKLAPMLCKSCFDEKYVDMSPVKMNLFDGFAKGGC